jgi:transcriptional regulator with XRE-family HTH domain
MSQDSVAQDSGLSLRQVSDYVRGRGNPTFESLLRLCEGLHVSLGELMTRTDDLREKRARR